MLLQLTTKPLNLAIIQAYAPTANHDYNDMEWNDILKKKIIKKSLRTVKSTYILISVVDMKAKIGKEKYIKIVGN